MEVLDLTGFGILRSLRAADEPKFMLGPWQGNPAPTQGAPKLRLVVEVGCIFMRTGRVAQERGSFVSPGRLQRGEKTPPSPDPVLTAILLVPEGRAWAVKHNGGILGYAGSRAQAVLLGKDLVGWLKSQGRAAALVIEEPTFGPRGCPVRASDSASA